MLARSPIFRILQAEVRPGACSPPLPFTPLIVPHASINRLSGPLLCESFASRASSTFLSGPQEVPFRRLSAGYVMDELESPPSRFAHLHPRPYSPCPIVRRTYSSSTSRSLEGSWLRLVL